MSRIATELSGWIVIVGVMLLIAPFLALRAAVRIWRRVELHLIYHGDTAAQEKASWHLR